MKIDYEKGVYHIYLSDSKENPEDSIHIFSDNIKEVKSFFINYIENRLWKSVLIHKFDKLMIECIKKQLEEANH